MRTGTDEKRAKAVERVLRGRTCSTCRFWHQDKAGHFCAITAPRRRSLGSGLPEERTCGFWRTEKEVR